MSEAENLERMGNEDAQRWWRSMTVAERERQGETVDKGEPIRGNLAYDKGFRLGWQRIRERHMKGGAA